MNTRKPNGGGPVRLSESKLKAIIAESVQRILKEYYVVDYDYGELLDTLVSIEKGRYDNMIPQWGSGERDVYDDLGLSKNMRGNGIEDAVMDRWCVIDKSVALKYGENPSDYPEDKKELETDYPDHENRNIRNTSYINKLGDQYWRDKEHRDFLKKMPHTFTGKGEQRHTGPKKVWDDIEKDIFGTDQADKRPLHRKGSLNRI